MTVDFQNLRLIRPDIRFAASFAEALEEGLYENPVPADEIAWVREDFKSWLAAQEDMTRRIVTSEGVEIPRVPDTEYWMVEGDRFIGRVGIRHELNAFLEQVGGHIGYGVRASCRGKGYGSALLRLALPKAKRIGLQKALITCDEDNLPSRRMIESCGGVLQDTVRVKGHHKLVCHYWISLTPANIKEKVHVG